MEYIVYLDNGSEPLILYRKDSHLKAAEIAENLPYTKILSKQMFKKKFKKFFDEHDKSHCNKHIKIIFL